jgi:hypothetical protein
MPVGNIMAARVFRVLNCCRNAHWLCADRDARCRAPVRGGLSLFNYKLEACCIVTAGAVGLMSEDVGVEKSGSKGEEACADNAAHGNFESLTHRIQSATLRTVAQRWHEVSGAKRMPSWTDILATDLSPSLNVLWVYKYDPKTTDFRFEFAGNRLRK